MSNDEPIIRVDDLSKSFYDVRALKEINLTIRPGRIVGLVGANGGGKSTLLRTIVGLYLPDGGRCLTFGREAGKLRPDDLARIGYVHQEGELIDWMTVDQMVRYVAAYYPGWNHDLEERYRSRFEINGEKRVGTLSPGERQKLAILLAIGFEPALLILDEPVAGRGEFMKFLIFSFWIGMVTASMMKEMLAKPLTLCLPRHQPAIRSVIFAVGGAQSVLLALVVLAYPGLDGAAALAGIASAACIAMTVYLVTVAFMFLLPNAAVFWGVPVVFLKLFQELFSGLRATLEDVALFHPLVNAVVLVPVAALIWFRLGSRDLARKQCGAAFLPLQYFWSRAKQEGYNKNRRIEQLDGQSRSLWRRIEGRFLARMGRAPAYSGKRHTAGSRYVHFGATVPVSPAGVVLGIVSVLAFVVLLGYLVPSEGRAGVSGANFLYVVPCIIGITVTLPLHSTLLVPAGRSERYRSCLVLGMRRAVIVALTSAALCAMSFAIGAVMPEVTVRGNAYTYLPMEPALAVTPLIVLPLLYACQIGFPRRPQIAQTVILIVYVVVGMAVPGSFLQDLRLVGLAVAGILCWWCFVGPLHHFCHHRDLVPM